MASCYGIAVTTNGTRQCVTCTGEDKTLTYNAVWTFHEKPSGKHCWFYSFNVSSNSKISSFDTLFSKAQIFINFFSLQSLLDQNQAVHPGINHKLRMNAKLQQMHLAFDIGVETAIALQLIRGDVSTVTITTFISTSTQSVQPIETTATPFASQKRKVAIIVLVICGNRYDMILIKEDCSITYINT